MNVLKDCRKCDLKWHFWHYLREFITGAKGKRESYSLIIYLGLPPVNFHCIFNNYLYLCYVMGCFSSIAFDTSWWLFFWLSSHFVFFSYFVLILLDGKGAAALSSCSTCCVDWRMENTHTVYLSPRMLLRYWATINSIFLFTVSIIE